MTKHRSSVTIRDVAREARVSVATVSRYVNQNVPVSEKLSKRIQKVMDRLDYVPHAAARQLALRTKNTVGLLLTNMHTSFFAPMLAGVEEVVREHGYHLLVATCHPYLYHDQQFPLGRHNTDGLLAFADSLTEERISQFYDRGFPLVLIHRTPSNGIHIPYATVENKTATHALIDHLIETHGRRNIMLMRGLEQQEDSYWREVGFKEALADHSIPFEEELALTGGFSRDLAYSTLKSFLKDPGRPCIDAVFAGDDEAAVGIYDALKECGLRIPEDVSVVGFNDSLLAPFLTPPLTTVKAPTEAVGRSAAEQLFSILEGKTPELATLHPTEIILRRSCGCDVHPVSKPRR
jgi:DNA-binding LacI/PurR family transcriptional regulator